MVASNVSMVTDKMIEYERGNPERIHHFLKVYAFAKAIGELEGLDERTRNILEVAAVMHDIGIKPSLEKYGSSAGNYQEMEGPAPAARILGELGQKDELVERVCWLVAHHHTYSNVREIDHRILIEADFLVNIHEQGMSREQIESIRRKCFETGAGRRFLDCLFLQPA